MRLQRLLNWKLWLGCGAALAVILLAGRESWHGKGLASPDAEALMIVPVVKVDREDLAMSETFDAEFRPYQVIELHAKVAGFVQSIHVDIGDPVKKGDLLAVLEIPELAEELERASAAVIRDNRIAEQAEANYQDAHLAWSRLDTINHNKPHLVARQDLDTAKAKDEAADASRAAAKEGIKVAQAELDKLKAVQSDCRIIAPFSGIITKRYADVGAFVQGGISPSGAAMPLVRLSQNDRLRLDFPVSVSFVHLIKTGDPVEIRITATGRTMRAQVSRFSHNVEMDTRTMETEVDVPNPDLSITPGIYAEARIEFERLRRVLAIPAEALSNLKAPTAFVVGPQNLIEERPLKLGLATPDRFEVLSGLNENDLIVTGSRSALKPGQKVEIKLMRSE